MTKLLIVESDLLCLSKRPDFEQRKLIWESVFPQNTPTKDLDFYKLAKINLPGGNIKNIALHASF
ncbi:MAG: hypothetical protein IPJ43_02555 [Saprospiraceae bacterium]|nr:hypothetical protein [Saprospiraceae bacterium]